MTLGMFLRQLSARAAALVVSLACAGSAVAADQTPPVFIQPPAVLGAASCPTCEGASASCPTCGPAHRSFSLFHKKGCKPAVPQLCPGACFGYFQTQWHRWENVCPIPYQGVDLADAPPRPTPALTPPALVKPPETKGSDAPLPKPAPLPSVPEKK